MLFEFPCSEKFVSFGILFNFCSLLWTTCGLFGFGVLFFLQLYLETFGILLSAVLIIEGLFFFYMFLFPYFEPIKESKLHLLLDPLFEFLTLYHTDSRATLDICSPTCFNIRCTYYWTYVRQNARLCFYAHTAYRTNKQSCTCRCRELVLELSV